LCYYALLININSAKKMDKHITKSDNETLKNRLKIEWTYTSNAIEGNTISLSDTAFIIEQGLTVKGKSIVEYAEIVGHTRAIDLIYQMLDKAEITKSDICTLHKAVQTNLVIDIDCPIGDYKVEPNARYVKVDGRLAHRYYPLPEHTSHLMGLFFAEFGDISKPVASFDECVRRYADIHVAFSSIHPFFDGNGRLARLIANIPLLKNGYLPIIISNEDRQEYIESLAAYDIASKPLDENTASLVEKNEFYDKLYEFFKNQYKNSQILLDEIRNKK